MKPAPKSSRSSDTSKILLPRANHDAFKETSKNRLMWVVAMQDLRAALQKEELGDLQALQIIPRTHRVARAHRLYLSLIHI